LLKVAIGRLQVEREDVKKQSQAMIEGNDSGNENETDKTFLTGAQIEEREVAELEENAQALVE